jgi:hypothetical protein
VAPLDQANLPSVPDTRSLSDVASPNEREIECYPKQCSSRYNALVPGTKYFGPSASNSALSSIGARCHFVQRNGAAEGAECMS